MYEKCIEYIGKFMIHFQGDFDFLLKKVVHVRRIFTNFTAHFLESP